MLIILDYQRSVNTERSIFQEHTHMHIRARVQTLTKRLRLSHRTLAHEIDAHVQAVDAGELGNHLPDFFPGQNCGQALGPFCPHRLEGQIQPGFAQGAG
jgi:hypothetical protein